MGDRKVHNRKQTIDGIEQAIEQLQASQGKLSISAVAKMAGVTPALIHNTYPDLAEKCQATRRFNPLTTSGIGPLG
ncbi:hypothetical protein GO613_11755 [Azoarcus communis]|uniref:hypothetical protein n=1 Tax=Parazoarcus communis TaxID=41977 RepID=UPI001459A803|nr:hypothetical protein [Parazoarcus communis]NMG48779.1 hypothetical protein [Parazoarcus communis]